MLWPMALPICATSLWSRLFRRSSAKLQRALTIQLTRGLSWSEPIETIDRRKCDTISIEFVAAEALHWLLTTQKNVPTWGVTHYRVVNHGEAVIGGDTLTAANVRGAHVRWLEATRSKERTR